MDKRIRVYSTPDALKAEMIQIALRDEGIACEVENAHQAGFTGGIDVDVTVTEKDAAAAEAVIQKIDDAAKAYTLVVSAFDDEGTADEVQLSLQKMEKAYLIDLNDSVVIVRHGNGKVVIKQTHNLTQDGALAGGLCGAIIGAMFANPVIGFVAGAAAGAAVGATEDIGIDDKFLSQVGESLTPGTSALAILVRRSDPELVLPELEKYEGRLLQVALLHTDEDRFLQFLHVSRD